MAGSIRIYNRSKQMIPISVQPPNGDFYSTAQNIYLQPGKTTRLLRSYLNEDQIKNLQKKQQLQVIFEDGE